MPNRMGQLVEDTPNSFLRDASKGHRDPISHRTDYDGEFRFELFLLDDGQKKVEQKDETRKPSLAPSHTQSLHSTDLARPRHP